MNLHSTHYNRSALPSQAVCLTGWSYEQVCASWNRCIQLHPIPCSTTAVQTVPSSPKGSVESVNHSALTSCCTAASKSPTSFCASHSSLAKTDTCTASQAPSDKLCGMLGPSDCLNSIGFPVSFTTFRRITGLSRLEAEGLFKIFNPRGCGQECAGTGGRVGTGPERSGQVEGNGGRGQDHGGEIPILEVLAVAVGFGDLSKATKVSVLYSLFDLGNKHYLHESELYIMYNSLLRGLARLYNRPIPSYKSVVVHVAATMQQSWQHTLLQHNKRVTDETIDSNNVPATRKNAAGLSTTISLSELLWYSLRYSPVGSTSSSRSLSPSPRPSSTLLSWQSSVFALFASFDPLADSPSPAHLHSSRHDRSSSQKNCSPSSGRSGQQHSDRPSNAQQCGSNSGIASSSETCLDIVQPLQFEVSDAFLEAYQKQAQLLDQLIHNGRGREVVVDGRAMVRLTDLLSVALELCDHSGDIVRQTCELVDTDKYMGLQQVLWNDDHSGSKRVDTEQLPTDENQLQTTEILHDKLTPSQSTASQIGNDNNVQDNLLSSTNLLQTLSPNDFDFLSLNASFKLPSSPSTTMSTTLASSIPVACLPAGPTLPPATLQSETAALTPGPQQPSAVKVHPYILSDLRIMNFVRHHLLLLWPPSPAATRPCTDNDHELKRVRDKSTGPPILISQPTTHGHLSPMVYSKLMDLLASKLLGAVLSPGPQILTFSAISTCLPVCHGAGGITQSADSQDGRDLGGTLTMTSTLDLSETSFSTNNSGFTATVSAAHTATPCYRLVVAVTKGHPLNANFEVVARVTEDAEAEERCGVRQISGPDAVNVTWPKPMELELPDIRDNYFCSVSIHASSDAPPPGCFQQSEEYLPVPVARFVCLLSDFLSGSQGSGDIGSTEPVQHQRIHNPHSSNLFFHPKHPQTRSLPLLPVSVSSPCPASPVHSLTCTVLLSPTTPALRNAQYPFPVSQQNTAHPHACSKSPHQISSQPSLHDVASLSGSVSSLPPLLICRDRLNRLDFPVPDLLPLDDCRIYLHTLDGHRAFSCGDQLPTVCVCAGISYGDRPVAGVVFFPFRPDKSCVSLAEYGLVRPEVWQGKTVSRLDVGGIVEGRWARGGLGTFGDQQDDRGVASGGTDMPRGKGNYMRRCSSSALFETATTHDDMPGINSSGTHTPGSPTVGTLENKHMSNMGRPASSQTANSLCTVAARGSVCPGGKGFDLKQEQSCEVQRLNSETLRRQNTGKDGHGESCKKRTYARSPSSRSVASNLSNNSNRGGVKPPVTVHGILTKLSKEFSTLCQQTSFFSDQFCRTPGNSERTEITQACVSPNSVSRFLPDDLVVSCSPKSLQCQSLWTTLQKLNYQTGAFFPLHSVPTHRQPPYKVRSQSCSQPKAPLSISVVPPLEAQRPYPSLPPTWVSSPSEVTLYEQPGGGSRLLEVVTGNAQMCVSVRAWKWDCCAADSVLRSIGGWLQDVQGRAIQYGEGETEELDGPVVGIGSKDVGRWWSSWKER
eukprot:GHVQ01022905.1.p1 GENE.GHVQ01022905.1~~GHVQ01022905.1.p1  ORF type:complete len:1502 (-),score=165.69 GHVQ01022905.1:205-4710(-)